MNEVSSYYSMGMYLIYNAFGIYVIFKFNKIFFNRSRVNKNIERAGYIVYFIIISGVYEAWNLPVLTIGSNISLCFLITCLYKENWLKGLSLSILINAIFFLMESVAYLIVIRYDLEDIEFILTFLSTLATFSFVMALGNLINSKKDQKLTVSHWLAIFIVPLASIYVVFILVLAEYDIAYTGLGVTALLIVNFLIFYLYDEIAEVYEAKYEKALLKQKNEAYLNEAKLIKNSDDNLRKLKHDLRNHVLTLSSMAEKQEYEKILSYLTNIQNELLVKGKYVCTHNVAFDSILNYKLKEASVLGANITVLVDFPETMEIDEFDLTIILGNLLDNAIESLEKCNNKFIELNIKFQRGLLFIYMKNPVEKGKQLSNTNVWKTHKRDKENHGFGLLQIKKSVEKYNGSFDIALNENICETKILMYIK